MKKRSVFIIVFFAVAVGLFVWWPVQKKEKISVRDFEECVEAGNPVMESYPRQCRFNEEIFIENIGNELEKKESIHVDTPRPNQIVTSPLLITGEARGPWFFEASFPVILTNWDGLIIAQGVATASSSTTEGWMTSDFVPFTATLIFTVDKDVYSQKGTLVLRRDNPSGLPEYDEALEIPVIFAENYSACTKEAKLCPDGSAVERTGSNCEFSPCP